jgi:hypothetical protein
MFIFASGMVMRRMETVMVATGGSLPKAGRLPPKAQGMTLTEQPEAAEARRLVSSIEGLRPAPHGAAAEAPEAASEALRMTLTEQPEAAV